MPPSTIGKGRRKSAVGEASISSRRTSKADDEDEGGGSTNKGKDANEGGASVARGRFYALVKKDYPLYYPWELAVSRSQKIMKSFEDDFRAKKQSACVIEMVKTIKTETEVIGVHDIPTIGRLLKGIVRCYLKQLEWLEKKLEKDCLYIARHFDYSRGNGETPKLDGLLVTAEKYKSMEKKGCADRGAQEVRSFCEDIRSAIRELAVKSHKVSAEEDRFASTYNAIALTCNSASFYEARELLQNDLSIVRPAVSKARKQDITLAEPDFGQALVQDASEEELPPADGEAWEEFRDASLMGIEELRSMLGSVIHTPPHGPQSPASTLHVFTTPSTRTMTRAPSFDSYRMGPLSALSQHSSHLSVLLTGQHNEFPAPEHPFESEEESEGEDPMDHDKSKMLFEEFDVKKHRTITIGQKSKECMKRLPITPRERPPSFHLAPQDLANRLHEIGPMIDTADHDGFEDGPLGDTDDAGMHGNEVPSTSNQGVSSVFDTPKRNVPVSSTSNVGECSVFETPADTHVPSIIEDSSVFDTPKRDHDGFAIPVGRAVQSRSVSRAGTPRKARTPMRMPPREDPPPQRASARKAREVFMPNLKKADEEMEREEEREDEEMEGEESTEETPALPPPPKKARKERKKKEKKPVEEVEVARKGPVDADMSMDGLNDLGLEDDAMDIDMDAGPMDLDMGSLDGGGGGDGDEMEGGEAFDKDEEEEEAAKAKSKGQGPEKASSKAAAQRRKPMDTGILGGGGGDGDEMEGGEAFDKDEEEEETAKTRGKGQGADKVSKKAAQTPSDAQRRKQEDLKKRAAEAHAAKQNARMHIIDAGLDGPSSFFFVLKEKGIVTKRDAAMHFYAMLAETKKLTISVAQETPFGDIEISKGTKDADDNAHGVDEWEEQEGAAPINPAPALN